ncbi:hypothetical protein KEJ21_03020 [Candidatus Bathyarchaeota archaeon]|nr:hypothetical protein [Candidatus Bathyarchaeota archaeon]MBS7630644.1 hypothetical protein [Candidatus Bathyarchaeota archaeon]
MDPRIICISHREDADGIICASFLRRIKNASTILVSYDELESALSRVKPPVHELYICDVNIREELMSHVLRISRFSKVTIVDHHPTAKDVLDELGKAGVHIVFSPVDCASVLLYDHFKDKLGREGARLAAYAAISDQFEDGPIALEIISKFDKHYVHFEALILTYALLKENSLGFRDIMMDALSRYIFPHKITGILQKALEQVEVVSNLIELLPNRSKLIDRFAYTEVTDEVSLGTAAGLILDSMDVDVGLSYKKNGKEYIDLSIRARRGLKIHLGEVTKMIAKKCNGYGGGHSRASGAKIPKKNFTLFLKDFEEAMKNNDSI